MPYLAGMPPRGIKILAVLLVVLLLVAAGILAWMAIRPPPRPAAPPPGAGAVPAPPAATPPAASRALGGPRYYAGQPAPAPGFSCKLTVLDNTGYSVGYCPDHKGPAWAAYRVFDNDVEQAPPWPAKFTDDPRVQGAPHSSDYTGMGYDCGHCAPNYVIAVCYGSEAQHDTFLMTNILPQRPVLNRHVWEGIERAEARNYRRKYGTLWVVDGPVYGEHPQRLPGGEVVPDKFFRIIVREVAQGEPVLLAYVVPQAVNGRESPAQFLVSVDHVEAETHLDFLRNLPDG